MVTEHAAHPGLGERPARSWPMQHHETLRRGKRRRALAGQVSSKLGEEHAIDRDDPFPATLAQHPQLPASLVHIGEQELADLPGPQPAEHHGQHDRPVPVRPQASQEQRHISRVKRLRQPPFLTDQPAATPHPARTQMPQQPARLRSQPLAAPRRRHRVIGPRTSQNQILKQCPGRGNPPVHRRRRRPPATNRHDLAIPPPRGRLPVNPVKDVRGHQVAQADASVL